MGNRAAAGWQQRSRGALKCRAVRRYFAKSNGPYPQRRDLQIVRCGAISEIVPGAPPRDKFQTGPVRRGAGFHFGGHRSHDLTSLSYFSCLLRLAGDWARRFVRLDLFLSPDATVRGNQSALGKSMEIDDSLERHAGSHDASSNQIGIAQKFHRSPHVWRPNIGRVREYTLARSR